MKSQIILGNTLIDKLRFTINNDDDGLFKTTINSELINIIQLDIDLSDGLKNQLHDEITNNSRQ